jgi:hypothetical protein
MNLHRDTTGEEANRIVNHPDVRPSFTSVPDKELDFRPLANDPNTLILVGDPPLGTFVFYRIMPGVFEAHGASLPEGRGEWTDRFARHCLYFLFTGTDCIEILTRVPQGHLPTATLVRQLGFTWRWSRPATRFRGKNVPFAVWSLTMMDWFPHEDELRLEVLRDMKTNGPPRKAENWEQRWAFLSRDASDA